MTQPPHNPGRPEPDPDATRIRPATAPGAGGQPHPPYPPQPPQPQPTPYTSYGPLPPDPPAERAKSGRGRIVLFVGVVVVVLGLLAGAVVLFLSTGDSAAEVTDLGRGDCVQSAAIADRSADVADLEVVSCDKAHDAEVVATTSVADSEEPTDACLQAITDEETSVAALSVEDREVRPLSAGDDVACLVVGDDLEGSILQ